MINQFDQDNEWKKKLRDKLAVMLYGTDAEKEALYVDIGYCYQCYAPASLYKYYSDTSLNLDSIKSNRMWYSSPIHFNDVFDCEITTDEKKLFESTLEMCPNVQKVRIGSPIWKNLKAETKKSAKEMQNLFTRMRFGIGVSCLSELDDSLLMWAHYANNHRGMCVEYDLLEISSQLKFTPVPIVYSEERVCFNSLNTTTVGRDTTKMFLESLTTKSPEWSYEKEWRIIREDSACGELWDADKQGALLDMIQPSSITLGCMARPEFEKEITALCNEKKIDLFKMQKDTQKYRLIKTALLQFND